MSDQNSNDPLSTGAALGVFSEIADDADSLSGRQLGDYRVKERIARGGMSVVYRAERSDGSFERDVAIKISPVSALDPSLRERFLQEQAVLAGLNHPNISQLYDAGVTEEGWPYIVMELIDGQPITDYVRSQALDRETTLKLVADVIDAVSFAHSQLIVHRDIKPSNILVDEQGRVKLLDFGIAKLMSLEDGDLTRLGAMTPRYASPELLLGRDITIASDIYQIGLLLFEVLTGRAVEEDTPLSDAVERAARRDVAKLPHFAADEIPPELVRIIEQCLRPTAADRYRDASSLKRDLLAFMEGYPVSAVGNNPAYRFRKFVQRNRPTVTLAVAASAMIIAGTIFYTASLNAAREQAESREAAANRTLLAMSSLISDTFTALLASSAERNTGNSLFLESVLKETMSAVESELERGDAASAELYRLKASVESILGDDVAARRSLVEARSLLTKDADSSLWMKVEADLVQADIAAGERLAARERLDAMMVNIDSASMSPAEEARLADLNATLLRREAKLPDAESEYRRAISILETSDGDPLSLAGLHYDLSSTYNSWERFDDAATEARKAIEILDAEDSPVSFRLLQPLRSLSFAAAQTGDFETARQAGERGLEIALANFGELHPTTGMAYGALAVTAQRDGRLFEAEALNRKRLEISRAVDGESSRSVISAMADLALGLHYLGRNEEALEINTEVLAIVRALTEDPYPRAEGVILSNQGLFLDAMGRHQDAAEARRESVAFRFAVLGPDSYQAIDSQMELAMTLVKAGQREEADELFAEVLDKIAALEGADSRAYKMRELQRWHFDLAAGDLEGASTKLATYIELAGETREIDRPWWILHTTELADQCLKLGKLACAASALEKTAGSVEQYSERIDAVKAKLLKAELLKRQGQMSGARRLARDVMATLRKRGLADDPLMERAEAI